MFRPIARRDSWPWLSVDEIAIYLGSQRDTVYKWIERKSMPAHKVERLWKFRKEEIDQWVRGGGSNRGDRGGTNDG
ncbi:helix-turn-helix domain protein [bacterium BMS3Abin12]|nr:helix-turn-helix domain protein [bacterium BMS3Abin12]